MNRMLFLAVAAAAVAVCWCAPKDRVTVNGHPSYSEEEKDKDFWWAWGEDEIQKSLNVKPNTNTAKNVILFLGDGMSLAAIFGGRVMKGQLQGNPGEETELVFERFPSVGLSKTYSVDHQISDSAVTSTAYQCGVKSIYGTIGVGPSITRGSCEGAQEAALSCMSDKAMDAGKSAGFVTTAHIAHASPGPMYASSVDRNWVDDSKLPDGASDHGCQDIAAQILNDKGSRLQVLMGGGRQHLTPNDFPDPEYPDKHGNRLDGKNIPELWLQQKHDEGKNALYAWHKDNLTHANVEELDYLMGAFEQSHMKYSSDPGAGVDEPTLEEMVEAAIKILSKNEHGFYLFVEGAKIDLAEHYAWARLAVQEVVEFDKAVGKAVEMTDEKDTLIVVTADHSHGMLFSSFPLRGNDITGLTDWSSDAEPLSSDKDHKPYTTAVFANGPGYWGKYEVKDGEVSRVLLTKEQVAERKFQYQSPLPLKKTGHEGSDVGIYARGPWSHLIHTTHQQNYIHHVMAYASCVGSYHDACEDRDCEWCDEAAKA